MKQSKSSIFLTEIIVCIFLFSVISALCIQVFLKAYFLSNDASDKTNAVFAAESVAAILESTHSLTDVYPTATLQNNLLFFYYDKNWEICNEKNTSFTLTVSPYPVTNHNTITISVTKEEKTLYSLELYLHQQNIYGGNDNET